MKVDDTSNMYLSKMLCPFSVIVTKSDKKMMVKYLIVKSIFSQSLSHLIKQRLQFRVSNTVRPRWAISPVNLV